MSVRLYSATGIGFIIGEKISQDEKNVYLKYPAVLVLQAQTPQGPRDMLMEPVPNIFASKEEMMKRFSLKKDIIIYGGKPEQKLAEMYEQYATQLQTRLSGIQVVGAGAIPRSWGCSIMKEIKVGQLWLDDRGVCSDYAGDKLYVVCSQKPNQPWVCACFQDWIMGAYKRELNDKELNGLRYIGRLSDLKDKVSSYIKNKGGDPISKKDGNGPPSGSGGKRDGSGKGKGRAPGKGTGKKTGGKKGKC